MNIRKKIIACSIGIVTTFSMANTFAGEITDIIFVNGFEPDLPQVVAFSSFEEPVIEMDVNDGKYFDTGSDTVAHSLVNNNGEAPVVLTDSTTELDFSASWAPYNSLLNDSFIDPFGNDIVGLTDGDWIGVTTFQPPGATFTDGLQGYQLSDTDGTMTLASEPVDLSNMTQNSMSIDYYIATTTWEIDQPAAGNDIRNDGIRIYAENSVTNERYYILDTLTDDIMTIIDIDDLGIEGAWQNGIIALPDDVIVRFVIEFRAGSSSEIIWLDNLKFIGKAN
ncbi:MAG: hypothetical protein L3J53_01150 [Proteobacteria bacterium]|nr:hypothetical protein [Pseudomonadota bacterium]